MCTAVTYTSGHHYFGRTLDLDHSYEEQVTVTPRNYPLVFRHMPPLARHHAMIGMAFVLQGYPLYYDAVNEHGLGIAGLNFPGNATYYAMAQGKDNVTPFELIPWLLGQCATVAEVRPLLARLNLLNESFAPQLPLSPLHWVIADKTECIVVETMAEGMRIYENPVGVMANNPPFDFMLSYLATYRDLSPRPSENRLGAVELPVYCQGLGARGLPGDWSSASRFVRASFIKLNALPAAGEAQAVSQFFHILDAVSMPRGCVALENGRQDITVYAACCDQDTGVYYYTTYDNHRIAAVDMHREDLEGNRPVTYGLAVEQDIFRHN